MARRKIIIWVSLRKIIIWVNVAKYVTLMLT